MDCDSLEGEPGEAALRESRATHWDEDARAEEREQGVGKVIVHTVTLLGGDLPEPSTTRVIVHVRFGGGIAADATISSFERVDISVWEADGVIPIPRLTQCTEVGFRLEVRTGGDGAIGFPEEVDWLDGKDFDYRSIRSDRMVITFSARFGLTEAELGLVSGGAPIPAEEALGLTSESQGKLAEIFRIRQHELKRILEQAPRPPALAAAIEVGRDYPTRKQAALMSGVVSVSRREPCGGEWRQSVLEVSVPISEWRLSDKRRIGRARESNRPFTLFTQQLLELPTSSMGKGDPVEIIAAERQEAAMELGLREIPGLRSLLDEIPVVMDQERAVCYSSGAALHSLLHLIYSHRDVSGLFRELCKCCSDLERGLIDFVRLRSKAALMDALEDLVKRRILDRYLLALRAVKEVARSPAIGPVERRDALSDELWDAHVPATEYAKVFGLGDALRAIKGGASAEVALSEMPSVLGDVKKVQRVRDVAMRFGAEHWEVHLDAIKGPCGLTASALQHGLAYQDIMHGQRGGNGVTRLQAMLHDPRLDEYARAWVYMEMVYMELGRVMVPAGVQFQASDDFVESTSHFALGPDVGLQRGQMQPRPEVARCLQVVAQEHVMTVTGMAILPAGTSYRGRRLTVDTRVLELSHGWAGRRLVYADAAFLTSAKARFWRLSSEHLVPRDGHPSTTSRHQNAGCGWGAAVTPLAGP
jgi:hypothetical protein